MNPIDRLTLDDWMLISKCVMFFGDSAITEFKEHNMPSMGAARTVANKLVALGCDLKRISDLLYKIDDIATEKVLQKKDGK